MPSQICHALAGYRALDHSAVDASFLVSAAFNLGCQGPDLFSHNRLTKPLSLAYSRMLHRNGYGRFCGNLARRLVSSPDPLAVSWFFGFVTHQEVDRCLHPYIIYRSHLAQMSDMPGVNPALIHAFLERIIDVRLLWALEEKHVSEYDTGDPFYIPEASRRPLAALLAASLCDTYPELHGEDDIELRVMNAFSDAINFYAITNPVLTDMRKSVESTVFANFKGCEASDIALLYPENPDPVTDWLNLAALPWKNPADGSEHNDSALSLFHEAASRAAGIIGVTDAVLRGSRDPEELAREIGDGCLSIAGADGRIVPVQASEPFDLVKALGTELERRRRWLGARLRE